MVRQVSSRKDDLESRSIGDFIERIFSILFKAVGFVLIVFLVLGLIGILVMWFNRTKSSSSDSAPSASTAKTEPSGRIPSQPPPNEKGEVLVICRVTLGSGQQISLDGFAQLLRSDRLSYREINEKMEKDEHIGLMAWTTEVERGMRERTNKNLGQPGADVHVDQGPFVSSVGSFISRLPLVKVGEAEFENGEARISNVPAGDYILYGSGRAGMNFVGFLEPVNIQTGQRAVVKLRKTYTAFVRPNEGLGFQHLFQAWKPF
jgi:hypothetical protein